jgi:hypothetical protein
MGVQAIFHPKSVTDFFTRSMGCKPYAGLWSRVAPKPPAEQQTGAVSRLEQLRTRESNLQSDLNDEARFHALVQDVKNSVR